MSMAGMMTEFVSMSKFTLCRNYHNTRHGPTIELHLQHTRVSYPNTRVNFRVQLLSYIGEKLFFDDSAADSWRLTVRMRPMAAHCNHTSCYFE